MKALLVASILLLLALQAMGSLAGQTFGAIATMRGDDRKGGDPCRGSAGVEDQESSAPGREGALDMTGSTFEGDVNLNRSTVDGAALLRGGATFKGKLDLGSAKIGSRLEMDGSTFEKDVNLNSATVDGSVFLRGGATFKGELDLVSAKIGSHLEMDDSAFEGDVFLNGAKIGSVLAMVGSTFEGDVNLNGATVDGAAFLRGEATFKGGLNLGSAKIGSLEMNGSTFEGEVNLTGCTITRELRLGFSKDSAARWKDGASLTLRNTHVGALQDWWLDECTNA